ncbi:MAG: hypothetical protein ACO3CU_10350, partial [Candidatus Nanopelagicales bacterium]
MSLTDVVDDGPIRILTMRHPERRNALSHVMADEMSAAIEDAECRSFILRAESGAKTWSAGHDIDDPGTVRSGLHAREGAGRASAGDGALERPEHGGLDRG